MKEISTRRLNPAEYYKKLHSGIKTQGKNNDDSVTISEEGKKKLIAGHIMTGLLEMVMLKGRAPKY